MGKVTKRMTSVLNEADISFKLRDACKEFIQNNQITEQTIEDQIGDDYFGYLQLIKQICEIVGYHDG
jgi:hypothetical protein